MIDIERKWLVVYSHSPREEGQWFFGISVFRHRWEFGLTADWHDVGSDRVRSRYYFYLQHLDPAKNLVLQQYEFPRKNRWADVTN